MQACSVCSCKFILCHWNNHLGQLQYLAFQKRERRRVRTDHPVPKRTISKFTPPATLKARWGGNKPTFQACRPDLPCNQNLSFPSMCNFRRRLSINGLNQRSVLRVSLELKRCLKVGTVSRVRPVILGFITTTRPPAPPAHLEHTLMGWNVLKTLCIILYFSHYSSPSFALIFVSCSVLIVFLFGFISQHVSGVRRVQSLSWVTSTNGGMFFLRTWRLLVLMWATPNVTEWMVGNRTPCVYFSFLFPGLHVRKGKKSQS